MTMRVRIWARCGTGVGELARSGAADWFRTAAGMCGGVRSDLPAGARSQNAPKRTDGFVAIRNAPEDRLLTEPEWAEVARQVMDGTGYVTSGVCSAASRVLPSAFRKP